MHQGIYTFHHGSYAVLTSPKDIDPAGFVGYRYGGKGLYVSPTLEEVLSYGGKAFHQLTVEGNMLDLTDREDFAFFNRIRDENPDLDPVRVANGGLYDLLGQKYHADIIKLTGMVAVIKNLEKIKEIKPIKILKQ